MKRLINFRTGLVTLGLLVGLSAPAFSVPMLAPAMPASPVQTDVLKVRDSWAGGNDRGGNSYEWRRGWRGDGWRGDRGWRGGRHWRGDGWRGDRGWRRGWRDDGWRYPRHHRRSWNNSGVYLGLGLLGSGMLYDDYYYRPRPRIYRAPRASGHVQWCYSRYRSYRAWDNTFQPNYGPRRECVSPYRY
ncbi:BA14K family protein [Mesorhizobium loti]|nr:BA14K family protein [Mesorhizobium loti]PLP60431.1 BA14K family protein [Mesorhizobium loti]